MHCRNIQTIILGPEFESPHLHKTQPPSGGFCVLGRRSTVSAHCTWRFERRSDVRAISNARTNESGEKPHNIFGMKWTKILMWADPRVRPSPQKQYMPASWRVLYCLWWWKSKLLCFIRDSKKRNDGWAVPHASTDEFTVRNEYFEFYKIVSSFYKWCITSLKKKYLTDVIILSPTLLVQSVRNGQYIIM